MSILLIGDLSEGAYTTWKEYLAAHLPAGEELLLASQCRDKYARGKHLVDEDLLAALESGRLSHAVLDVFHQEPLPTDHPLWSHPRITVLPHVAATTDPASAARIALENVAAFRAGRPLTGLVSRSRGY